MWPDNVRGFDWTQPPMAEPPTERTNIGYFCWIDCGVPSRRDYYVLPDGSAEIIFTIGSGEDKTVRTQVFKPGKWQVIYPYTKDGSRGGCWIGRKSTNKSLTPINFGTLNVDITKAEQMYKNGEITDLELEAIKKRNQGDI